MADDSSDEDVVVNYEVHSDGTIDLTTAGPSSPPKKAAPQRGANEVDNGVIDTTTAGPSSAPKEAAPHQEVNAANTVQYKSLSEQVRADSYSAAKQERNPELPSIHLPLLEGDTAFNKPWEVETLLNKIDDYPRGSTFHYGWYKDMCVGEVIRHCLGIMHTCVGGDWQDRRESSSDSDSAEDVE
ncbi:hypothetical protein CYMTET_37702 [Cymbomonas tetramitiformis]|uniref:Uncharacterized protein n=1 Tax=Cymbomonas tetramitiformis TaxID=36881 RepID=A0AAE0F677_9CHLO|nr:hypothetical protein CYMTET_37703 [Cymbomonas tetramitiformis]KAK3253029.1 hypothetical protein CYMTET_37702 [Cymbomonas tetramitiformis]